MTNHEKNGTNIASVDGRSQLRETESITFRIDSASKRLLQAHALSAGYRNVSEYLRQISIIPPTAAS